jgi:protein phosphatase
LLCSDGLSGVVSKDTLRDTLTIPDPERAVDALVDLALRGGAPDNVTCIVCDVVDAGRAPSAEPVVGGSVTNGDDERQGQPNTAAGRAAALRGHRRASPRRGADDEAPRRHIRGPLLVLALLVIVAGALFGGTWWYSQHQYYIGSSGQNVEIYKGIKGSILGINFSTPVEDTQIAMSSLPAFERDRIADGITAHSRSAADRIVDGLRQSTQPQPSPSTSPSSAPSSTPSGTPSAGTTP